MLKITTHTMASNDENFIWYSLLAVKDSVTKMIVYNDHSSDKTLEIIQSISDPKIELRQVHSHDATEYTACRNQMIANTTTDWFLILDGDEVWNKKMFLNFLDFVDRQPKNIYGVAVRTRNCIGDVYHYLPEDAGKYELLGRRGHLSIRAYRRLPGFSWVGAYPYETYVDKNGQPINKEENNLAFFEGYYWHLTHLPRTSSPDKVKGFRRRPKESGIAISSQNDLPEVFFLPAPAIVPSPLARRSWLFATQAAILTPLRKLKRRL